MDQRLDQRERAAVADLLSQLVAIPSVNRGLEQARTDQPEKRIAAFVADYLADLGMQVETQPIGPGRPNVIGHWPDQRGQKRLVVESHMDTVGVEGMTIDPFDPMRRGGRLYGRGACDTKGSLAAFLAALHFARRRGLEPADRIYFVGAASEETGCQGAQALVDAGFRCDGAIIGEPTNCHIVSAHKGSLWLKAVVHGRSSHASTPQLGRNAIVAGARIVDLIESKLRPQLQQEQHDVLDRATVSIDVIRGGTKVNIVPDTCELEVDLRLLPDQEPEQIVARLNELIADALPGWGDGIEVRQVWASPAMLTPADASLVRNLLAVTAERTGQQKLLGMPYFADAGPFRQTGADAVLFGPGDPSHAHTADESIELEQLYMATEIILELLTRHQKHSLLA